MYVLIALSFSVVSCLMLSVNIRIYLVVRTYTQATYPTRASVLRSTSSVEESMWNFVVLPRTLPLHNG